MTTPRLWAISDLHVGYDENRRAVEALPEYPGDWLIVAGDTGETPAHLDLVLRTLSSRSSSCVSAFSDWLWISGLSVEKILSPASVRSSSR